MTGLLPCVTNGRFGSLNSFAFLQFLNRNYTDQNWKSHKSNPWYDTVMPESWLNFPLQRRLKRDYEERRVKVCANYQVTFQKFFFAFFLTLEACSQEIFKNTALVMVNYIDRNSDK